MPSGRYCPSCRGVRLHAPELRERKGRAVAVLACTACDRALPLLGLYCPACLGRSFSVYKTRSDRPGVITRVRVCRRPGCGTRLRTGERLESLIA